MSRPTILHVGGTLYWTIRLYDPTDGVTLIDADSTPTCSVRKNGAAVGDSVTVTKRSATTGIYDCSYNPAGEVEGDQFGIAEAATIGGTAYSQSWEFAVVLPVTTRLADIQTAADAAGAAASDASIAALAAASAASSVQTVLSGITSLANWLRAIVRKDMLTDATALEEINDGGGAFERAESLEQVSIDVQVLKTVLNGITSLANWLRLGFRKSPADSTALEEINTGGTSAYDPTVHSQEEIGDKIGNVQAATFILSASSPALEAITEGGKLTFHRGDKITFQLVLGSLVGRTGEKLIFTVKPNKDDDNTDSSAIIQATETSGAVLLNGEEYATPGDVSIVVDDEDTGATNFTFLSDFTDQLRPGGYYWYDVQMIDADGEAETLTEGQLLVAGDVTRRRTLSP